MALHGPGRASRRPATCDVESGAADITSSTLHRSPTPSTLGGKSQVTSGERQSLLLSPPPPSPPLSDESLWDEAE